MKINTARSFLQSPGLSKQLQAKIVKSDVAKAMTTNATTIGRQTNKQDDQLELGRSSEPGIYKKSTFVKAEKAEKTAEEPQESGPAAKSPGAGKKSKEELFEDLTASLGEALGDEDRSAMLQRAGKRVTGKAGLEKSLAKTAFAEAKAHLKQMRPGASEKQVREDAKSDEALAKVLNVYDASSAYLGLKGKAAKTNRSQKKAEQLAKELAERNETLNKLHQGLTEMMADNRKAFAELMRLRDETNTRISALWFDSYRQRVASQNKQFTSFLSLIRESDT